MQIKEFLELARTRRSIRKWKPDLIPDEYIEQMLEAARWAMSGANAQPWEFIVIKSREIKLKLAEVHIRFREAQRIVESTRSQEFRQPHYRINNPIDVLWTEAPVVIAIVGDQRTLQASTLFMRYYELHTFDQNMANATTMLHLAAAALGLGAEWISIDQPMNESMKPILGIPAEIRLFTLNPVGYPAGKPAPYRRKLSELIHQETYDMSRFRSQSDIQEYIKSLRQMHEKGKAYPDGK